MRWFGNLLGWRAPRLQPRTHIRQLFISYTYSIRLLGAAFAASHLLDCVSLLVQQLLIACLKMIIIVDAIKHFVIKRISHRHECSLPIQSIASGCIQVAYKTMSVFLTVFCLLLLVCSVFFLSLIFRFSSLCCSVLLHAVSSSETITRYNL